jgi:hypothetical protein
VFENRVLRRIFGPKRDEVTGEWRGLHNKELYVLYSSPNIIAVIESRRVRWTGCVAHKEGKERFMQVLVRKPEERRPFGKHNHRK